MKKIIIVLTCSIALFACQDEAQKILSSNNKELGVIIQNNDVASNNALVLLKDGRTINPLLGFENFPSTQVGKKVLLSFNIISESNSIYNVDITEVVSADDSTFVFTTPPLGATDSIATVEFLVGSFTGSFTYCQNGNCNSGQTTLTLAGASYLSSKDVNNFPAGGAGTFSVAELSNRKITFNNNLEFISVNPDLVLHGKYDVSAFDNYLSLIRWNGNTFTSYLLKRQ